MTVNILEELEAIFFLHMFKVNITMLWLFISTDLRSVFNAHHLTGIDLIPKAKPLYHHPYLYTLKLGLHISVIVNGVDLIFLISCINMMHFYGNLKYAISSDLLQRGNHWLLR